MTEFLQYVFNGLVVGGTYALLGVGLALIYGIMRIVNFAQGEFYMLGAYFFYTLWVLLGINPLVAMLAAFVAVLLFGLAFERIFIRPLRKEPPESAMLMCMGLAIVLQNAALLIWGGEVQTVPKIVQTTSLSLGGVVVSTDRIWIFAIAVMLIMATNMFIARTKTGRALRATFQDTAAAEVVGVNIEKIYSITFGFGVALAAAGGFLLAPLYLISPTMGALAVGKAFAVVVLGGMGNIQGAIFGGLLLGVVESLGAGYISSGYKDAFGIIVMILVILFRPQGLLGRAK